jgi:cell shape-determining protein MreD
MILLVLFTSSASFAESGYGDLGIILDAVVARPAGIASMVVGTVFYIIALPFTASSGTTDKAAQELIVDPFNYTFLRPIGDYDNYVDRK